MNPDPQAQEKAKICMLGAFQVGKTSLVRRFVSTIFDERYIATIGVKTDKKVVTVDGRDRLLMLWDVAGPEERFTIPNTYLRGLAGYLLVIDGTRPDTLDRAVDLVEQVRQVELTERRPAPAPVIVLLNKSDLADQWRLDESAMAKLAPLNAPILKCSAKTGQNVEVAFQQLADRVFRKGE